jgi:hypothetical protein
MWQTLGDYEEQVHSQGGEDGVVQRIFDLIGAQSRFFVEFGAGDGIHISNTANLRLNHGWRGLLMEASERADGEVVKRAFVDAENVCALFRRYDVPQTFDLLSIDIDGNDYWVWKAIEEFSPRVVLLEYNIFFDLADARTIRYNADHVWDDDFYHGASLAALRKLGHEKGYRLVYTDSWVPNAFFVRDEDLPADYQEPAIGQVTPWKGFVELPEIEGDWVSV